MEQKNSLPVCTTSDDRGVGLVSHYQFENGSSQFVFLHVEDGNGAALVKQSLSFFTEDFVQTLASSNGLLLLSGYKGVCYYVFNPLNKQIFMIPQPRINGHVVRTGLASDDSEFQVVLVEAGSSKPNGIELLIFSSDTGAWRRHHPINLSVPSLPEFEFQELVIPPLYSNGAIHWEIGGHLLVYQVKSRRCELHELPNVSDDWSRQLTMTNRGGLCESGGRVYYCYTDFDGFHIWGFLQEHDHPKLNNRCYDPKRFSWKLVHTVKHNIFISKYRDFCGQFSDWEPYKITPIAYNEPAQIIYLKLPGIIFAYNLDTRNWGSVCSYSYPGMDFNCCSFLPFITSGLCNMQRDGEPRAKMELNLPVAEAENLSL